MSISILVATGKALMRRFYNTTKILVGIFLITTLFIRAVTQHLPPPGKELFESKCVKCHGADGTKGRWGAKNLNTSRLSNEALLKVISDGKGIMPKWGKKLTPGQIDTLIGYIKTLRN